MGDHEPTIHDDPDQQGEALDSEKLPDEFPDRPVASRDYGVTEAEQAHREGLTGRLAREEPDVFAAELDDEAPRRPRRSDDGGLRVIGDLDEAGVDNEADLVGESGSREADDDLGRSGARSPEEAAMHIVEELSGSTDRHAVRRKD